ncbi:MAG TPA: nuclear transport factor 2 family protein, partial [Acidimicrobiia bacterium]
MDTKRIEEWAESYRTAWEAADSAAAAALFSEDATYRNDIFQEPNRSRSGVIEYWKGVTAAQSDVTVRMGKPFVDGDRAVVEFWTTMKLEGAPVTIGGALLLEFDETGLCQSLREYYAFADGSIDPPPEWG